MLSPFAGGDHGLIADNPSPHHDLPGEECAMSTEDRVTDTARVSPWASGLTVFAGALMIVDGIFVVLTGIAALLNDKIYVSTPGYIYAYDLTTWGWIHLLLGVLIGLAGLAVLRGQTWG